jgi:hypothetical protein
LGSKNIVTEPDHISDPERRLQALEDELTKTLLHYSTDDLLIADLKRRMLHLRDDLERLRHETVGDRRLH